MGTLNPGNKSPPTPQARECCIAAAMRLLGPSFEGTNPNSYGFIGFPANILVVIMLKSGAGTKGVLQHPPRCWTTQNRLTNDILIAGLLVVMFPFMCGDTLDRPDKREE
ncbi:hypothetical protein CEXT_430111 [Caerostris extrusa]|uniref:Uncharacterized protein n=1 Tax=Caerostris extrusa TaxID=172846 RepID=A0AAV4U5C4_CAEEX|nr:hypothetical protein CEXT_430111 [Caerostris extrusa]